MNHTVKKDLRWMSYLFASLNAAVCAIHLSGLSGASWAMACSTYIFSFTAVMLLMYLFSKRRMVYRNENDSPSSLTVRIYPWFIASMVSIIILTANIPHRLISGTAAITVSAASLCFSVVFAVMIAAGRFDAKQTETGNQATTPS